MLILSEPGESKDLSFSEPPTVNCFSLLITIIVLIQRMSARRHFAVRGDGGSDHAAAGTDGIGYYWSTNSGMCLGAGRGRRSVAKVVEYREISTAWRKLLETDCVKGVIKNYVPVITYERRILQPK
jgi:hypothetical protein